MDHFTNKDCVDHTSDRPSQTLRSTHSIGRIFSPHPWPLRGGDDQELLDDWMGIATDKTDAEVARLLKQAAADRVVVRLGVDEEGKIRVKKVD